MTMPQSEPDAAVDRFAGMTREERLTLALDIAERELTIWKADNTRLRTDNTRLRTALSEIAEGYHEHPRYDPPCSDGQRRENWCDGCVAVDALGVGQEGTTGD